MVRAGPGGDFGAAMRRAREQRGVSLRDIAAATKISPAALEALERNDISRLPGGLFSRAFVRSYATAIGLDPEQTVRDFLAQFPHESVTAGSPHVPQEDHEAIESERQSAQTALKLIAISLPLVLIILYFSLRGPSAPPARPADVVAADPGPSSAPDIAMPEGTPLVFEVMATAPVTVRVEVDGQPREAQALTAGERLEFEAGRGIRLEMSDAAAVQLSINGHPAAVLGSPGESRVVEVTRANAAAFLAQP